MLFSNSLWETRLGKCVLITVRSATKRASGGKSANNSTAGRRLGAKKSENEYVEPGMILWRQRGTKWYPGENCGMGRDHTIFAKEPGFVRFYRDPFHAKRRFIGVALQKQDRLPTPHFEPTRRRFGFTPIDNEDVSQFELQFFGRKETHELAARELKLSQRSQVQQQRMHKYSEFLASIGLPESISSNKQQLQRLNLVYQYICGSGLSFSEADKIVSTQIIDDLKLDLRVGRISKDVYEAQYNEFISNTAKVNEQVMFTRGELVSLNQINETKIEKVESKLSALTGEFLTNPSGTPPSIVEQATKLLESSPGLTTGELEHLKRKYLRRPMPINVDKSNLSELESRAKKGEGKLISVFNEKLTRVFVPEGSKVYL